jgi:hypothetical protein
MSQRQKFIDALTAEVGYIEGPKDNETKFGALTKVNFQPWCGSYMMWGAHEAGLKIPNCVSTAAGAAAFKKEGHWKEVGVKPEVGYLALFDFPNDGVDRISHIGAVKEVHEDGTMIVIEGNTTPDGKTGSQRNGGEACLKVRAWKKDNAKKLPVFIVGYGTPVFTD